MSHPFGDFIRQHLSRKHGLSQNKLAEGIDQDAAIISAMCHGRRLTGPQVRDRVLAIIRWFREQGVLEYEEEANALLEAAGLVKLNTGDPQEQRVLDLLRKKAPQPPNGRKPDTGHRPPNSHAKYATRLAFAAAMVIVAVIGIVIGKGLPSESPVWQEDFDPILLSRWLQIQTSAIWEDVPGPVAMLRENDPYKNLGKVESEIITVDIDVYPILRVNVTAVDRDASYTVQILDKHTGTAKDVLKEKEYPGEHAINLAQEMNWRGSQTFTINIWIGGEGKSVTFGLISIQSD
jgi:hypothetical protein